MKSDRPLLGILLMLGFCVLAPVADAVAKLLGQIVPLGFVIFVRFAAQFVLLAPMIWLAGRTWQMDRRMLGIIALRTVLHIAAIGCMLNALIYLPLADAIAICFILPFLLLLMGWLFLNETVGPRRLSACTVGFAGTLLIVQPSFAEIGWPALLPIGTAFLFAIFMLITRRITQEMDPISLQAFSGAMAVILLTPVIWSGPLTDIPMLQVVNVDSYGWMLLLTLGGLGTFAHLLMTWSLRFAPSATLAPMQYLEIPFAAALGWAIFDDLPGGLTVVGMVLTVGAGLYIILHEQASARRQDAQAVPQPAE